MDVVSHEFPITKIEDAFKTAEWLGSSRNIEVTRAIVTP